jgi:hypothetical protein
VFDNVPILGVAPKQLVRALSGEHHLDPGVPSKAADRVQRHAHGVGDRLISMVNKRPQSVKRVLLIQYHLMMLRAEPLGDPAGLLALVMILVAGETNREAG